MGSDALLDCFDSLLWIVEVSQELFRFSGAVYVVVFVESLVLDTRVVVQQSSNFDDFRVGIEHLGQALSVPGDLRDVMSPDSIAEDVGLFGTRFFHKCSDFSYHGVLLDGRSGAELSSGMDSSFSVPVHFF
jgi:hypothetical protein